MHLHFFQHVSFEALGAIERWALEREYQITRTRCFEADSPLPNLNEVDILISMGGPMSVHDERKYAWLATEKACLREAIAKDKHVLGICLGAQLIAEILGAEVTPNPEKEIGFFPVTLSEDAQRLPLLAGLPEQFMMFHWHGERFGIPEGAVELASSEACGQQGFIYGDKVMGWQCHPEMTQPRLQEMMDHVGHELKSNGKYVQSADEILALQHHLPDVNRYLFTMLDRWISG